MSDYIRNIRKTYGSGLLLLPSVCAIIKNSQGEILLHKKPLGQGWSLPAGMIEPGENPEEAIAREVLEETGYELLKSQVLTVLGGKNFRFTYPNGDEVEYTIIVFNAQIGKQIQNPEINETTEIRFFPPTQMPKLALPYPQHLFK